MCLWTLESPMMVKQRDTDILRLYTEKFGYTLIDGTLKMIDTWNKKRLIDRTWNEFH